MQVLGVSGGNGVILSPFKNNLIGNIEGRAAFKTPGDIQWESNFRGIPLYKSLAQFDKKNLLGKNKPLIIVGAPDCGHSSQLALSRRKGFSDPKENVSLKEYIEAVNKLKPLMFFMENLPALIKTYGEDSLRSVFPGYSLKFFVCPMSRFGNSQVSRVRLVIVGYLTDVINPIIKLPRRDRYSLKTCGELLGGLPKKSIKRGHVREPDNTIISIYSKKKMAVGDIKLLWQTKFKNRRDWPVEGRNFKTAPAVYRNQDSDYPRTARRANRQFNHSGEMMSPRELARIQGVPDKFKIHISKSGGKLSYWINKGRTTVTKCPPYEMGLWIKKQIIKNL